MINTKRLKQSASALAFLALFFSCKTEQRKPLNISSSTTFYLSRVHQLLVTKQGFVQWEDTTLVFKETDVDIFSKRTIEWEGDFDLDKAMKMLYPGNYYKVFGDMGDVRVSLWKPRNFLEMRLHYCWDDDSLGIPFPDTVHGSGVDTRLLDTAMFISSDGHKHILLSTSSISEEVFDMLLTGRFSGGVLGLAMFDETKVGWALHCFDPAIGIYGSFSTCPRPQKFQFGIDNFGCLISNSNGGAGGPYTTELTAIGIVNGKFKKVWVNYFNALFNTEGGGWSSTVTGPEEYVMIQGPREDFQELTLITNGDFSTGGNYSDSLYGGWDYETEFAPEILKKEMNKKEAFGFTMTTHYRFNRTEYVQSGIDLVKRKFVEPQNDSLVSGMK